MIILGFSRKSLYPAYWAYQFLWSWPSRISSQFYDDPLEISILLYQPLWKSSFFPQILTYPLEFPITFPLPPGNFHWYPQQGGGDSNFLWKSPISFFVFLSFCIFTAFRLIIKLRRIIISISLFCSRGLLKDILKDDLTSLKCTRRFVLSTSLTKTELSQEFGHWIVLW